MTRTASALSVLRIVHLFIAILGTSTILAQAAVAQNTVPFVNQPLVPDAIAPGGPSFTLTVNGTGFVSTSKVNWNGSPRATTFINSSQLTAVILASDIATASTAAITVVSPAPGGGSSIPVFFPIATPEMSVSFGKTDVTTPGGNVEIVTADFNGDGNLDLALAAYYAGEVSILLGNGDGTFSGGQHYPACAPHGIAVGDFNGDGKLDLVTTNYGCGSATILLGNGDGSFKAGASLSTGELLYSVAVGDFNSDGKLDLVVVDNSSDKTSVFIGNGDGTFQLPVAYDSGNDSRKVVIGDFNRDGHLDFAVSGSAGVSVLLGNGDGTFHPKTVYPLATTDNPYLLTADVNGDGKIDLVVANTAGSASVLLGKGDGTFESSVQYPTGGYSAALAAADFNGNGVLDLLTTNYYTSTISLLPGHGDGTFGSYVNQPADSGARGIAVADFNGDGRLDVAVGNQFVDSVSVFLQATGQGQTPTSTTLSSSLNPSVYGQSATLTATVASSSATPTGTVIFYNGSTAVGSGTLAGGKAAVSVSSLPAGSDSITAAYQGSSTFAPSTSVPLTQVVSMATSATTLTSSLNPAGTGQSITYTATVTSQYGGAATGSISFYSGSSTLGTASLSGNVAKLTTSFSAQGTFTITAKYSGDANSTGSTSAGLAQSIIAFTTTTLRSSPNPATVGQEITFTATVTSTSGTPPNGETLTFKNGSAILGTAPLSAGTALLTTSSLSAGRYTITASYPGDSTFAGSTSSGLTQVVNLASKSSTSTTLASSLNPSTYGQRVTWTAKVITPGPVPPTGTVRFTWSGYSIGSATVNSSGVATLNKSNLNVYTYALTATYSGDTNNLGSTSAILSQVISQATSAATLTSLPNPSASGQAVTLTAKITSPTVTPTGPVIFALGTTVLGTVQLSAGKALLIISSLPVGSDKVTVTYAGDSNIASSSASVTQTVGP